MVLAAKSCPANKALIAIEVPMNTLLPILRLNIVGSPLSCSATIDSRDKRTRRSGLILQFQESRQHSNARSRCGGSNAIAGDAKFYVEARGVPSGLQRGR